MINVKTFTLRQKRVLTDCLGAIILATASIAFLATLGSLVIRLRGSGGIQLGIGVTLIDGVLSILPKLGLVIVGLCLLLRDSRVIVFVWVSFVVSLLNSAFFLSVALPKMLLLSADSGRYIIVGALVATAASIMFYACLLGFVYCPALRSVKGSSLES